MKCKYNAFVRLYLPEAEILSESFWSRVIFRNLSNIEDRTFTIMFNSFQPLVIVAKPFTLNVCGSPSYTSVDPHLHSNN